MQWLRVGQRLLTLFGDLHLSSSGDGQTLMQRFDAWVYSQEGQKFIVNVDGLLEDLGVPVVIMVRKKP